MTFEQKNRRPTAKPYQGKKKQRWPTRIVLALVSVGGLLGLWQFVAHETPAAARQTPSFQDAEQQLQLGPPPGTSGSSSTPSNTPSTSSSAPTPPDVLSGTS